VKKKLVLLVIAFQLLVPAWMAAEREWVVQSGRTVYLRTAPIDPRDIFRGDYVRLDYEASSFGPRQASEQIRTEGLEKGAPVYARLESGPRGLSSAVEVTRERPDSGPFLRGRALHRWRPGGGGHALQVRYGIEKYFVEQGRGKLMEQRRGRRQGIQTPMEVQLAVDTSGTAVITGHRWSPIGIGLAVKRPVDPNAGPTPDSVVMELTLQNTSDHPLSLILLPQLCSFALEPVKSAPLDLRPERPECDRLHPTPEHLVELAAEDSRSFSFDFNQERWWVPVNGEPTPIGKLEWGQRFRLVYRSPKPQEIRQLPEQRQIWQGELSSPAFHGRGQID